MSARKFRNTWWVDFTYHHERIRRRSLVNSRRGAHQHETLLRERLARGEPVDGLAPEPVRPTFALFAQKWFALHVRSNNRLSEQETKALILRRHLVPYFGSLPLDEVAGERIESYKAAKLAAGLAKKTINNHLIVLSTCLRSAVRWGTLKNAPAILWLKAKSERDDYYLSEEECRKILADVQEPLWHEMIYFALHTGLRRGELMALDWSDIDFNRRILTVRNSLVRGVIGPPKSNKERQLHLAQRLCEILELRRQPSGLVFSKSDGRPLTKSMMTQAMRRICRRVGIRHVGWHVLRHSMASYLSWDGHELRTVQKVLGHASITTTERYLHVPPAALGKAAEDLERRLG